MGEEVQKPEESKKPEETKKADQEEPKPDGGAGEKKEESKDPPPPPPPPQEIVLRVFMHCEGCARKVRRCLKTFHGVEDVQTDCKTHMVIVKGEKADPLKVLERIQKKSHRKVELLSPVPKPPADVPTQEVTEAPKPEEKTEEPPAQVITVVLKVNMHCEACAQEIRKRISRMKGVESAEADLKSSQVTVKGTFEAQQLVDYVYKRTGKHAIIVKLDPEPKKDEDDKGKDAGAGAGDGGEKKEDKKPEETGDGGGDEDKEKQAGGEEAEKPAAAAAVAVAVEGGEGGGEEMKVVELRKNEFYYYHPQNYQTYPPTYAAEAAYAYPPAPEMFSDENPNACSVM